MRVRYRSKRPGKHENGVAAGAAFAVALGVGAVTFYLTRAFLAREPVTPMLLEPGEDEADRGEDDGDG